MAPKKKKTVKNGFYYFMLEVQQDNSRRGSRCSLNEASNLAAPIWANMSPEEKKIYNDRAAAENGKKGDDLVQKFTSLGVSFSIIDAEEREKEEFQNMMVATIKSTVSNLKKESSLKTKTFFVCHVNYFYKTEDNYYAPAEFALAAFNLGEGMLESIHFFIEAGKLPLGMKFVANDWSTKTHRIPVNDRSWTHGESDYLKLFEKVHRFIKTYSDDRDMPPIYTMYDSLNTNYSHSAVKCAFENMCEAARMDPVLFKVYNIAILFFELRVKCSDEQIPSVPIMKSEIERDIFSYAKNIACYYHEENDVSVYCSLSMITRWIFTICDHCCKHINVTMILGAHVPKEAFLDWKQESNYVKYAGTIKQQTNSKVEKPLVIIDHGKLKEKRMEEKRQQEALYQKCEALRMPKTTYSSKIGANFSSNAASSSQTNDNSGYEDDSPEERCGASGRQGLAKYEEEERSDGSNDGDNGEWTEVGKPKWGAGYGRGRGLPLSDLKEDKKGHFIPLSGRGRAIAGSRLQ